MPRVDTATLIGVATILICLELVVNVALVLLVLRTSRIAGHSNERILQRSDTYRRALELISDEHECTTSRASAYTLHTYCDDCPACIARRALKLRDSHTGPQRHGEELPGVYQER